MKADLSFVRRLFVYVEFCVWSADFCVRIFGADFWCGIFGADFSVRIFRCGFSVRIFWCGFFGADFCADFCADFFADFFLHGDHRESDKKNPAKNPSKNPPRNPPQNFLSKNPPQNPPQTPLRTFASRSSLGLKGGAGAHLDALVEVGCQSRRFSGNTWQGLTQGWQVGVEDLQATKNSGLHKTFNMGNVVCIASQNACISTPLVQSVFQIGLLQPCQTRKKHKKSQKKSSPQLSRPQERNKNTPTPSLRWILKPNTKTTSCQN